MKNTKNTKISIEKLREDIDSIDKAILKQLHKRLEKVIAIGEIKANNKGLIYHPDREQAIISKLLECNQTSGNQKNYPAHNLSDHALKNIFSEIISACRSKEAPLQIAYLGPQGSYTEQAAKKQFARSVGYLDCKSIESVFASVYNEKCDFGVVPVENSNAGIVNATLDLFKTYDVRIYCEYYMPIKLCVLSKEKHLQNVKYVYSHVQPFSQSQTWLERHLPHALHYPVASTSEAARLVAKKKHAAAIASEINAERFKLHALAVNIEDNVENITRFVVISKDKNLPKPSNNGSLTSIIFSLQDKAGQLNAIINIFAQHQINLKSISSRPSKFKAFEYFFYIDLEGHIAQPKIKTVMDILKDRVLFFKWLGSYPMDQLRRK